MVATPVTMQGVVRTPADGARVATVLIELVTDPGQGIPGLGYIDANDYEVVATVGVTADADTGVWSTPLYANADIRPAGTYYRARYIVDSIEHPAVYFVAPPGGGWVGDNLILPPGNIPDASSTGRQIAFTRVAATLTTAATALADMAGVAMTVPIGTRPIDLEFYCSYMTSDTADKTLVLSLFDVTGAVEVCRMVAGGRLASGPLAPNHLLFPLDVLPPPGLRNYKMRWSMGEAGGNRNAYGNGFFGTPTTMFMRAIEH